MKVQRERRATGGHLGKVQCSATPRDALQPDTTQAFEALTVGSWLLCSPDSPFGTSDEHGLVIYEDYR